MQVTAPSSSAACCAQSQLHRRLHHADQRRILAPLQQQVEVALLHGHMHTTSGQAGPEHHGLWAMHAATSGTQLSAVGRQPPTLRACCEGVSSPTTAQKLPSSSGVSPETAPAGCLAAARRRMHRS